MATVPAGNGSVDEGLVLADAASSQAPPANLVNSEQPRPGATLTEGVEPPKRKTTSFKITNVFQSRPPSNDPDDIWEDGDDVDDSRTEDLSDIADSLTSLSSQLDPLVQAEGGQAVQEPPQPGQVNQTQSQVAPLTAQVAPPTGQIAPPTGQVVPPTGQVAPSTGQVAPTTGQVAPTTGQVAPSTGQVAPSASQVAPSAIQVTLPPGQVAPSTGQVAPSAGQVAPPPNQVAPPPSQVAPPTGPAAPSTGQVAPPTGQVAPSTGQVAQPSALIAPPQGQTSQPPVQGAPQPVQGAPPPVQGAPTSGQSAPPSGPSAPSSGQQRGQIVTVGQGQNGPAATVLGPSGPQVVMPQILPPVLQHQVNCPPQGLAPVQDTGRRPSHDPKLAGEARRLSATADENNQERAFQQGQAPYHLPGFGFVTFQPEGLPVTYVDYSGHLITAMVPATGSSVDKAGVNEDNQVLPVHGPLDIRSRFKIVKIETTEPIKRGRWTCFDFLDKQTDQKLVTTNAGSVPSSTDAKKTVSTAVPKSVVPSSLTKASAVASSTKVVVTQAGKVPLVPSSVSKPAVTLSSANASMVNSATVSAVNTPDAMPSSVLTRGATGQPRSDVAEVGRFKVASSEPPAPAARGTASGPGSVEREIEGANAATAGTRIQRTSGSRAPDPLRVSETGYPPATYPGGQGSMNGPNYINISPQAGSPYATINQPVIQSPVAVQGRPDFSGQQASGHMPGAAQQTSGHIPSSGQQTSGHQPTSGQQPTGQQMSSSAQQPAGHIQQHPASGHSSQASSNQQQFTGQPSQQSSPQSTVSGKTSQQVSGQYIVQDSGQYIVQDKSGLQYIVQQGQQPASHPSQQTSSHPTNQQPTSNHPSQQSMASGHPVQQASSHPAQPAGSHPSQQQQPAAGHTGQQVITGQQQQVVHMGSTQVAATVGHSQGGGGAIATSGHSQVVGTMATSGRPLGATVSGSSLPVSGGGTATGSVPTTVGHSQVGGSVSTQVTGHPQQFQPQLVQQLPPQQLIQQVTHPGQVPSHSQQQLPTHPSHVQQVPNQTQVSSQNQQVQTQSVSQTQQVIKPTAPQQVSSQQPPSIAPSTTQKKHSSSSQQTASSQPPSQPGIPSSIATELLPTQPGTSSTPPLLPSAPQKVAVGGGGHVVLPGQPGASQRTSTQNLVYGATPGYHYPPQYQQQGYSRSISHQPSTEVYNHHPGVEGEILAERLEEIVKEEQAVEDGLVPRPEEEIESGSGAGQASIDNRIEQAMDLVKSHLMNAVRSEVEELKDKINKLEDTISHLSRENEILRARASPETLQMVTGGGTSQPPDPAKPPVQQH